MLVAVVLFVIALFGIGGVELAERLRVQVDDADRRAAALVVAERVDALDRRLTLELERSTEAFAAVHRDHSATLEDYLEALGPFEAERGVVMSELLEERAELRRQLTAEEWTAVFEFR